MRLDDFVNLSLRSYGSVSSFDIFNKRSSELFVDSGLVFPPPPPPWSTGQTLLAFFPKTPLNISRKQRRFERRKTVVTYEPPVQICVLLSKHASSSSLNQTQHVCYAL